MLSDLRTYWVAPRVGVPGAEDEMDDRFTDDELRALLADVLAGLRGVPPDDPALMADVERAVMGRRGGS